MKKAYIIDPNFSKWHNIEFYIDSTFTRISCLGTKSIWYRLKSKEKDLICLGAFGPTQIKINDNI